MNNTAGRSSDSLCILEHKERIEENCVPKANYILREKWILEEKWNHESVNILYAQGIYCFCEAYKNQGNFS